MRKISKPTADHAKVRCDGAPAVGFIADVIAKAEASGLGEKNIELQPGQTWEQISDEVGRTQLAWILVIDGMLALTRDPRIAEAAVPAEFVRTMIEVARHATLAGSAKEALLSVDGFGPLGEKGAKFKPGRPRGAVGKVRQFVHQYMQSNATATAAEVWDAIKARPPAGVTVCENRVGKYIETAGARDTSYDAFANIVSKEKPK